MLAEGFRKENVASGFDAEYGWPFYDRLVAIYKGEKASTLAEAATKEALDGGSHLRFVTNHDKGRLGGRADGLLQEPRGSEGGDRRERPLRWRDSARVLGPRGRLEVAHPDLRPLDGRLVVQRGESPLAGLALHVARRTRPALREGDVRDLSTDDAVAFVRRAGTDEALVVANVRDRATTVALPRGAWRDGFSGDKVGGSALALAPFGFRVLLR